MQLRENSVLMIGLGLSGRAAATYLLKQGFKVWAVDDNLPTLQNLPEMRDLLAQGLHLLNSNAEPCQSLYERVVVSPGISKDHPWYRAAIQKEMPIMGEAELAFSELSKRRYRCIGITGTNGKTTVTLLIEHLLKSNGISARALGNVGAPLTQVLLEPESLEAGTVIVAELSSFQLETMQSPVFDIAAVLNVTDDHLDRYSSIEEYAQTKFHLFECIKPNGTCYIEEKCHKHYRHLLKHYSVRTYGYETTSYVNTDLKSIYLNEDRECELSGYHHQRKSHDIENELLAYGVAREFGISPSAIVEALSSFKKPPHRLEFVCEYKGVTFVDDSKATNVDAVVRAVESIPQSIILIAGGVDKGGSYAPWKAPFAERVRFVCTIGQAAEKIQQEIGSVVPTYHFESLQDAVSYAAKHAVPQEVVLLSPGCSSYDMFSSYVHRGECFKAIVHDLVIGLL